MKLLKMNLNMSQKTPLQLYFILLKLKRMKRYFKRQLFLCTSFSSCLKNAFRSFEELFFVILSYLI